MSEEEIQNSKQVNIEIASISDVKGQVNVAGGHIVHAEKGSTVIIGAQVEAAGGLLALSELMQHSKDVLAAVIEFRTDFRVAHEQVERLGDYKDLHDLLHHLQYHCYNGIAQSVTRFPNDELTLDNLIDYTLTLEEIIEALKRVATRPSMPTQELTWIKEIGSAKIDLSSAVDKLNESLLKRAIWRLNRLLTTQPARINVLLNHSARELRLPNLLSALSRVFDTLTLLDLDAEKVGTFQSGVDALGKLNQGLSVLVEDHDQCQSLDVELRRIEALMDRDLNELEISWPDLKLKADLLYGNHLDEWASALKKERDTLDEALRNNNPIKVRRSFRSYQRRASERFYRVDTELKALCGNLRQIGIPLASVLEMIG